MPGVRVEDVRVVATQVRLVSARYREVADALGTQCSRTGSALDASGAPWGEDAEGAAFARQYLPAAQGALHAVALVSEALTGIATTLSASWADTQTGDRLDGDSFAALRPEPPHEVR